MFTQQDYLQILREELVPALGCTEPISLAFGAAKARKILGELPQRVFIECSQNIIKNVKGVVVPNTNGMRGIEAAIAIGLVGGNSDQGLEVLDSITEKQILETKEYIANHTIVVTSLRSTEKLHYILHAYTASHTVLIEVSQSHIHVVRIELDGELVHKQECLIDKKSGEETLFYQLTIKNILSFCEDVDVKELEPIIEPQIRLNSAICQEGLQNHWGASVGRNVMQYQYSDIINRAKAITAAGSDARMSGCVMPVIINSGSGNQGLTASIPVIEFVRTRTYGYERLIRALAISNLVAIRQKVKMGRLSAFCGVVGAATGSGAAITWLAGGTRSQIEETISNTLATISGMICDGAKPSCAAKISVAVEAAFLGHILAMEHERFEAGDGLVGDSVEKTIDNIGTLVSEGMKYTDEVIVSLMVDKQKSKPADEYI
jgi:L-cysteine desulfidase